MNAVVIDRVADELSIREQKFCEEYLKVGNGKQSAIEAGYSAKSASSIASELLTRPKIQRYLSARQKPILSENDALQQRIMAELTKLAFSNPAKFTRIENGRAVVDFSNTTPEDLAALTSLKSKTRKIYNSKGEHIATEDEDTFRLADKYRGLELLGKQIGMFAEQPHRVVVDVADRLLNARKRLHGTLGYGADDDAE